MRAKIQYIKVAGREFQIYYGITTCAVQEVIPDTGVAGPISFAFDFEDTDSVRGEVAQRIYRIIYQPEKEKPDEKKEIDQTV